MGSSSVNRTKKEWSRPRNRPVLLLALVATFGVTLGVSSSTAAAATTRLVSGTVACQDNRPVVGVWVESSAGDSGWAQWQAVQGAPWIATYSKSLTTGASATSVRLSVGCGGTPQSWRTDNKTASYSVTADRTLNFRCKPSSRACIGWGGRVLLGMPVAGGGVWATAGEQANVHHRGGQDWAVDLYGAAGTKVKAKVFGPASARIQLRVGEISSTCGRGTTVGLEVYWNGAHVANVRHGHLANVPQAIRDAYANGTVIPNNSELGQLQSWAWKAGCWEVTTASGVHTHFSVYNVAGYSCYWNRPVGSFLGAGKMIGMARSTTATGPAQRCANPG